MPTVKQTQAFKKVLKGSNISQAMKDVGYSAKTATSTGKLTSTDGWQQLMDKYLSDDVITREHNKVLLQDADLGNKMKAVDLGHKLKGNYEKDNAQKQPQQLLVTFLNEKN